MLVRRFIYLTRSMTISSLPGSALVHCLLQPSLCLTQFFLNPLPLEPTKKQLRWKTLAADAAQHIAPAVDH